MPTLPETTIAALYTTAESLSQIAPAAPAALLSAAASAPSAPTLWTPAFEALAPTAKVEKGGELAAKKKPVDPIIFDVLMSNEVNRLLKVRFGVSFIVITTVFTLASYAIIVLASIYAWKMPAAAMTALVVQAPLQMVGILYIMARNLFPTVALATRVKKKTA